MRGNAEERAALLDEGEDEGVLWRWTEERDCLEVVGDASGLLAAGVHLVPLYEYSVIR